MNNKKEQKPIEKTLFKRPWFWVIFTIVVISITLIVFLFVNRQVDPKLDKNGDPVFVELTNEVYTNADDYLGYYINIKGKVFQVLGDNGSSKGVQVWLDPKTCNQNLWIYYSNDAEIKQDDYIVCSGYIKDITSYDNNYGAKVSAPLIVSSDIKKTDYIEVMSPSINYIDFSGLKATQHNYSISIDKVEFAEKETRVYFTADNKGKSKMYTGVGNSVILQNSKQYNVKENFDADYETIPFEIYSGVTSSGIVSFPNIEQDNFQLIVQIQSDNVNEKFTKMTFNINPANKNGTVESTEQKNPSQNLLQLKANLLTHQ